MFTCFMCIDVCFSYFLRLIGPILICAANGLISFCTYMYLTVLAPTYLKPRLGPFLTGVIVCFGV